MSARTGAGPAAEPPGEPGALLNPEQTRRSVDLSRHEVDGALAEFVDYCWVVRWDVDDPFDSAVLTQPKVHVVVEQGRVLVYGVSRRTFTRRIVGSGEAVGAAFHSAGFRPLLEADQTVAHIADRVVPAAELWPVDDRADAARIVTGADPEAWVARLGDWVLARSPRPDPVAREVGCLVAMIEADRSLRRVDDLAAASGIGVRTLQRLFREYVGASPKWVIRRRRLLDAAEAIHAGDAGDEVGWAELAQSLGYADQSHLVRDFTAAVGEPPAAYTRRIGEQATGG